MTDRPIIFRAPMVRALLDGRKTQTRRLAWREMTERELAARPNMPRECEPTLETPWCRVKPGDRLWLRETHSFLRQADQSCTAIYRADFLGGDPEAIDDWRPSIHMPRWASRLTLVVTEVRRQRLQEISEQDIVAEGLRKLSKDDGQTWKFGLPDRDGLPGRDDDGWPWSHWSADPCYAFAQLWDSINGEDAWAGNPEVVALTFTVHHCNIDATERAAG